MRVSAWEAPGHIWYESLKASSARTQFQEFADTTYCKARELYGARRTEQQAVLAAWREVGIQISGLAAAAGARAGGNGVAALTPPTNTLAPR